MISTIARCSSIGGSGTTSHPELTGRELPEQHPGTAVSLDASRFGKNLSGTDTDVQKALETVDQLDLGGTVTPSDDIPYPDGVGDPGIGTDYSRWDHVNPSQETAGGDLYLVDEVPAETITYYATPTIGFDLSRVLEEAAPEAWDSSCVLNAGARYVQ